MRRIVGLLLLIAVAGCTQPANQSGKRYLFDTERCADAGPKDSAEYKDCEKRLAEQDAQRLYNLSNGGQSLPVRPPVVLTP
jgi:hypothetical protein